MKSAIKKSSIALSVLLALSVFSTGSQAAFGSQQKSFGAQQKTVDEEINSAYDLLRFQEQMSKQGIESREELISRSIRLKAMTEHAKAVAIRSGIKSRINTIDQAIKANSRGLDAIYDFAPLMIDGKVVPPVISEANNLYNQKGDMQVNTAAKIFKIVKQARFASTATNWREYLVFPVESSAFEKYAYVAGDMKPKDDIELKAWQEATMEGWDLGVNQANIILKQGMERLNRDYLGMIRFHQFVMQGKLSMPVINQYNLYDTNDGTTMVLDENMLRISVLPTFNDQATISSLPQHQLNPNEYIVLEDEAFIDIPQNIEKLFNVKNTAPVIAELEQNTELAAAQPETYVTYSQPVIASVQAVLNDTSTDGNTKSAPPLINKTITTPERIAEDRQTSVGIYGSQSSKDTLLISVKTRMANGSTQ